MEVHPLVYLISEPSIVKSEIEAWLKDLDVGDIDAVWDSVDSSGQGEALVSLAGKRCYKAFEVGLNPNVQKIRDDLEKYLTNILEQGHGSVLEHAHFSFAIENVSRVFTGEMNRHRAGTAISEASMRYVRYDNIPFWMPGIFSSSNPEDDLADDIFFRNCRDITPEMMRNLPYKKYLSRKVFRRAFLEMEKNYADLVNIWDVELNGHDFSIKKKLTSAFRRIIGMGVATGGIWTGNVRALRHIITLRASEAAEEEIVIVALEMLRLMQAACPILFADFEIINEFAKPKYLKV